MMPGQNMTLIPKVAKTKQKNQSSRKKKPKKLDKYGTVPLDVSKFTVSRV